MLEENKIANVAKETNVGLPVALTLIAGILMVISGIVFLSMTWYHSTFSGYPMMDMMGGAWSNFMQGFTPWILGISISSIICGGIVLFSGTMMSKDPGNSRLWGIDIDNVFPWNNFRNGISDWFNTWNYCWSNCPFNKKTIGALN